MLPKINRLQKQKDIAEVLKKGKGFKEEGLVLKTKKKDLGCTRFAFLVSKKVSKKATQRNKIRRRIRETVRKSIKSIRGHSDNVFISQSGIEKKDFQGIKEKVDKLLKKANHV